MTFWATRWRVGVFLGLPALAMRSSWTWTWVLTMSLANPQKSRDSAALPHNSDMT